MGIYYQLSIGWLLVLAVIYLPYLFLFLQRRSYRRRKEITSQLVCALVILGISIILELIGISTSLWTYIPNNWPMALWLAYFGSGLLGYQLMKKIDEVING